MTTLRLREPATTHLLVITTSIWSYYVRYIVLLLSFLLIMPNIYFFINCNHLPILSITSAVCHLLLLPIRSAVYHLPMLPITSAVSHLPILPITSAAVCYLPLLPSTSAVISFDFIPGFLPSNSLGNSL